MFNSPSIRAWGAVLGAVGVLGSESTLSSSLSPEKDKGKVSGEGFLETEEAETLLEERLAMQQV